MDFLNEYSRDHLSVDLTDPSKLVHQFSFKHNLRNLIFFVHTLRFVIFAVVDLGEFSKFLLGQHLDMLGKAWVKFWATAFLLEGLIFLLCRYFVFVSSKDPNYANLIRGPILEQWNQQRRKLQYFVRFCCLFEILTMTGSIVFDAIAIMVPSLKDETSTLEFLYGLVWTYQMGVFAKLLCSDLAANAIFLQATCATLRSAVQNIDVKIKWRLTILKKRAFVLYMKSVLIELDGSCVRLKKFDGFWKRSLAINVIGYTMVMGGAYYLCMFSNLPPFLKLMLLCASLQFTIIVSYLILCPAGVNADFRKIHSRLCTIAVRYSTKLPIGLQINLSHALKRFSNPIAFTLWDTNYLEYMDYFQFVSSLCCNFILVANLISKH